MESYSKHRSLLAFMGLTRPNPVLRLTNPSQSSSYGGRESPYARNAIDNLNHTISHTDANQAYSWWKAELQDQLKWVNIIMIINRQDEPSILFANRLKNAHVMVSTRISAAEPSPTSSDWISVYQVSNSGNVNATIEIKLPLVCQIKRVAVYVEHVDGLALAELKVYGSDSSQVSVLDSGPGCLAASYPNDVSTQNYNRIKWMCTYIQPTTGSAYHTGTTGIASNQCDLPAGIEVRCSFTLNRERYCTTPTITRNLPCTKPEHLNFTITENATDYQNDTQRIELTISLLTAQANCEFIEAFNISITGDNFNGVSEVSQSVRPDENAIFNDLDAVTNYSISVVAINNEHFTSDPVKRNYTTGELPPESPPLSLMARNVNESCIQLNWQPPVNSNAEVVDYKVECADQERSYLSARTRNPYYFHCGFPAGYIRCEVLALNSIGVGPPAVAEAFVGPVKVSVLEPWPKYTLPLLTVSMLGVIITASAALLFHRIRRKQTIHEIPPNLDNMYAITTDGVLACNLREDDEAIVYEELQGNRRIEVSREVTSSSNPRPPIYPPDFEHEAVVPVSYLNFDQETKKAELDWKHPVTSLQNEIQLPRDPTQIEQGEQELGVRLDDNGDSDSDSDGYLPPYEPPYVAQAIADAKMDEILERVAETNAGPSRKVKLPLPDPDQLYEIPPDDEENCIYENC